ncbi:hypothetical protein BS17DRAFT_451711 [Gyrodon lividus]|nr:hypothetical protein BS17DRAFT_451711 [Gyrodon lividus]
MWHFVLWTKIACYTELAGTLYSILWARFVPQVETNDPSRITTLGISYETVYRSILVSDSGTVYKADGKHCQ